MAYTVVIDEATAFMQREVTYKRLCYDELVPRWKLFENYTVGAIQPQRTANSYLENVSISSLPPCLSSFQLTGLNSS